MVTKEMLFVSGSHLPRNVFYSLWKESLDNVIRKAKNENDDMPFCDFYAGYCEEGLSFVFMKFINEDDEMDYCLRIRERWVESWCLDVDDLNIFIRCINHVVSLYKEGGDYCEGGSDEWVYIVFVEPSRDGFFEFKGIERYW